MRLLYPVSQRQIEIEKAGSIKMVLPFFMGSVYNEENCGASKFQEGAARFYTGEM